MKRTMHRWHLAFGGIELTVETSPAHRSPTTSPTPLNPRSIMLRKNRSRPAASSRMPPSAAMASRRPSVPTPMATRTPAFSTVPAPQQPAGVVHPACAHAREAHLHQRLLDAGFAPPATLDHRRPEQGALQFGRLETQLAGLGGQRAPVVAGAERLPAGPALVSGGVGDLVGLGVEHGVDGPLDLDPNQGIGLGLEHCRCCRIAVLPIRSCVTDL